MHRRTVPNGLIDAGVPAPKLEAVEGGLAGTGVVVLRRQRFLRRAPYGNDDDRPTRLVCTGVWSTGTGWWTALRHRIVGLELPR